MIPFPFNENRFSFFVADHRLVGQLCTNPKSDRSLLSCLKGILCSTSDIGDALLYNSCSLPIHIMTTGPLPAPLKCKSWLQKECYDFVPFSHWPPFSPDLNQLDYFVWSYVENITNMTSHNTKASLIAFIRRVFAELPPALVKKTCSQFRIRIEAVIGAEGGYIE